MDEDELDLESRQLCADGSCTGVIGADGRCKECGRSASATATATVTEESPPAADWKGTPESDDFDARQLCPDGGCTGLLGADGCCKVCGKSS